MRPTLLPGDRLWVDLGAYRSAPPAPGEIVVLVDPGGPERWLVKRIRSVEGGAAFVVGDAPGTSRDSRSFGTVPLDRLVGRVVACYAPPARRRALFPEDGNRIKSMWE